ncbi:hypothetical protein JL720_5915 [Aureococcus anophagefferens]|nr:hypothetical protein JL720_5915 [Aureococcus anophagefferens]
MRPRPASSFRVGAAPRLGNTAAIAAVTSAQAAERVAVARAEVAGQHALGRAREPARREEAPLRRAGQSPLDGFDGGAGSVVAFLSRPKGGNGGTKAAASAPRTPLDGFDGAEVAFVPRPGLKPGDGGAKAAAPAPRTSAAAIATMRRIASESPHASASSSVFLRSRPSSQRRRRTYERRLRLRDAGAPAPAPPELATDDLIDLIVHLLVHRAVRAPTPPGPGAGLAPRRVVRAARPAPSARPARSAQEPPTDLKYVQMFHFVEVSTSALPGQT